MEKLNQCYKDEVDSHFVGSERNAKANGWEH